MIHCLLLYSPQAKNGLYIFKWLKKLKPNHSDPQCLHEIWVLMSRSRFCQPESTVSCFLTVCSCFKTAAAEGNGRTRSFRLLVLASRGQPAGGSSLASLAPLNTFTSLASQPSVPRGCPVHSVGLIEVLTLIGFVFKPYAPQALLQDSATQADLVAPAFSPGTYSALPRLLMVPPEFTMVLG